MYMEKQKQLSYKNRRLHPRLKCRVTIEFSNDDGVPMSGDLVDLTLAAAMWKRVPFLPPAQRSNLASLPMMEA